jgi:hypothetical protein
MGSRGALLWDGLVPGGEWLYSPSRATAVKNVTGAGDCMVGSMLGTSRVKVGKGEKDGTKQTSGERSKDAEAGRGRVRVSLMVLCLGAAHLSGPSGRLSTGFSRAMDVAAHKVASDDTVPPSLAGFRTES